MACDKNNNSKNLDHMISRFLEYFQCAICMNDISFTYITKDCAHRYCEKCIKECIDTLHKCPLCNHRLNTYDDIVKDVQHDNLLVVVKMPFLKFNFYPKACVSELKAKNDEKLFKGLVDNVTGDEQTHLSPLEAILKKHLFRTLNIHKTYYKEIEQHYSNEIDALNEKHGGHDSLNKQLENEKFALKNEFKKSVDTICKMYDTYLTENTPKPSLFPVTFKLRLLHKQLDIGGFVMKPNESCQKAMDHIQLHFEKINDKVVDFPENPLIFCIGPFSKLGFDKLQDIHKNYIENSVLPNDIVVINQMNCKPILEYSIKPGSQLVICGKMQLESDLPPKCFAKTFEDDNSKTVDYYSCATCNLKWICKSCKSECHKEHDTNLFILGHKPTWACCYCKRSKCYLITN